MDRKKLEQLYNRYKVICACTMYMFQLAQEGVFVNFRYQLIFPQDPSEPDKIGMEGVVKFLEDLSLDPTSRLVSNNFKGENRKPNMDTLRIVICFFRC